MEKGERGSDGGVKASGQEGVSQEGSKHFQGVKGNLKGSKL